MHDIATLAYAAGIFDGEGHISIQMPKGSKGKRYHRLQISLVNTDVRIIAWLHVHFGGCIGHHRHIAGCKTSSRWQMTDKLAESFLTAVRPYMLIKAEQADIALAFRATKLHRGGAFGKPRGTPASPVEEVYEEREVLRHQLQALTKRGAPVSPN